MAARPQSARAINRRGGGGGGRGGVTCVTYSTDREGEVSKIFILSLLRI